MEKGWVLIFILLSASFLTIFHASKAQGAPTILKVLPPPTEVHEGEDFTVSTQIYDALEMQSFQFQTLMGDGRIETLDSVIACIHYGLKPPVLPPIPP